jgi:hypothetical protein
LVEPYVVKIGTSSSIHTRVAGLRMGTFRRIALLAWSDLPAKLVHRRFNDDRITQSREFFKLSPALFSFINERREAIGFLSLEEASLWDFGGPLSTGFPVVSRERKKENPAKVSPEEASRRGRYYTHLRWHQRPKASCEFCSHPAGQKV